MRNAWMVFPCTFVVVVSNMSCHVMSCCVVVLIFLCLLCCVFVFPSLCFCLSIPFLFVVYSFFLLVFFFVVCLKGRLRGTSCSRKDPLQATCETASLFRRSSLGHSSSFSSGTSLPFSLVRLHQRQTPMLPSRSVCSCSFFLLSSLHEHLHSSTSQCTRTLAQTQVDGKEAWTFQSWCRRAGWTPRARTCC